MAITIEDIEILKEYFNGVINRADYHADNVNEIVLALIGGVIWRSEGSFKVKEYAGLPANILWMDVNNQRYCFKFNHITEKIDCCEDGHNGNVIASFDNQTSITDVKAFFESI